MIIRIAKFIGLKVIEIAAATLVLYLCSFYALWIYPIITSYPEQARRFLENHWLIQGFLGLLLLFITLLLPVLVGIGIYLWIIKNWEWSNK